MQMTNDEIIFRYKYKMDRSENRIRILADLNCCPVETIADILGVKLAKRNHNNHHKPNAINHLEAFKMYKKGVSDRVIARKYDVHPTTIREWRKKQNLPANINYYDPSSRNLQTV